MTFLDFLALNWLCALFTLVIVLHMDGRVRASASESALFALVIIGLVYVLWPAELLLCLQTFRRRRRAARQRAQPARKCFWRKVAAEYATGLPEIIQTLDYLFEGRIDWSRSSFTNLGARWRAPAAKWPRGACACQYHFPDFREAPNLSCVRKAEKH